MLYLLLTMEQMIMGLFHVAIPVKSFGDLTDHKFKILANSVMWLLNKLTHQATFIIIMIPSTSRLLYIVKRAFIHMISFT